LRSHLLMVSTMDGGVSNSDLLISLSDTGPSYGHLRWQMTWLGRLGWVCCVDRGCARAGWVDAPSSGSDATQVCLLQGAAPAALNPQRHLQQSLADVSLRARLHDRVHRCSFHPSRRRAVWQATGNKRCTRVLTATISGPRVWPSVCFRSGSTAPVDRRYRPDRPAHVHSVALVRRPDVDLDPAYEAQL
jgi:hypothetical protein